MSNNPLQNYFRKPSLTIKLPSQGIGYKEGAIEFPENNELPVYPMTAMDEINVKSPDGILNGMAIYNLVKSCVPNIKDPWEISNLDLDTILLGIKIATSGSVINVESECPECNNLNSLPVNLLDTMKSIKQGDYTNGLSVRELDIKFKPLTYKQVIAASQLQTQVQQKITSINDQPTEEDKIRVSGLVVKELNQISMALVADAIEYIKTPESVVFEKEFIKEFLENCDKETFDKIKNTNVELRTQSELKPIEFTCTNCNTKYNFGLDISVESL